MKLSEMARPAKPCPKCGKTITGNHYWYKGEWKCKGGGKQPAATASTPAAGTPSTPPAKAAPTAAPAKTPAAKPAVQPTNAAPAPRVKTGKASAAPAPADTSFEQKLDKWLKKYNVSKYNYDPSGGVSMEGTINVVGSTLERIPVKFGNVGGNFSWVAGSLSSLENGPTQVGGNYIVTGGTFASLAGGPTSVGGDYSVMANTALTSIDGVASNIGGMLLFDRCSKLTSLEGIHEKVQSVETLTVTDCPIQSNILGVMMIEGLQSFDLDPGSTIRGDIANKMRKAASIVRKHIESEARDPFACMDELIEAGLDEYAQQ
jgi:hypothetical protein